MKLAVLTDVHANLPALRAALGALEREGFDLLVHLGDAIAIGPFPSECLELLLSIPKARFIMGNHDALFVQGLPATLPVGMSEGEARHQRWTHAQIKPDLRNAVAGWPYHWHWDFDGVSASFYHYALDAPGKNYAPITPNPTAADLDAAFGIFAPAPAMLTFYGHDHAYSDVQGRSRYVNPGSLGCAPRPIARYCVVEFERGNYRLEHRAASYDSNVLRQAFEEREVPEREFLYRAFLGGLIPGSAT